MANPLDTLSTGRKILLIASILLFIDSFLPWYHASVSLGGFHASANASGWHQLGVVAWLLLIVLIAVEAARLAGALPLDEARGELATLAAAALVVLFGLIFVIQRLSDGALGFGFYLGVLLLIALAYGAFEVYRAGNAAATIRAMQSDRPADPPAAP